MQNTKKKNKIIIITLLVLLVSLVMIFLLVSRTNIQQAFAMEEYYSIEEKENFFIVEHYDGIEPMFSGHIIRGGERASRADLDWFTIGINVVCNYTGDFGILTNEHNVENRTIYRGGAGAFGRTIGSARRSCPDYDAAFIPFENQNNWAPTPFARYGGNFFGNISMGVESLIIEGLPVKRIGITTGISMGTISRQ